MNFISWAFVLLFLPVFAYRLIFGRRKIEPGFIAVTLVASTIFVMWHVPAYILIMLTSIGVDYVAARLIYREPDGSRRRKLFLVLSMTTNLLLLGFFKYANFALGSVERMLHSFGALKAVPRLDIILPMGISFYTFGSMSYTIDVYRGRLKPVRRFRDFYYFVTFFPHLVSGPIIRAEQFFYQFPRVRRPRLKVFNHGAFLIVRGLFLKTVCADNIAGVVNDHWSSGYQPHASSATSLLLTVLFAAQIFYDFEGYSSIARGLAFWMGFRFPLNFDYPYIAASFSNFWERWHITLSRWLRDYLYIPLGGNRGSEARTYANLLIVMVLGGLWHGAAWSFLAWGTMHGLALAVERLLGMSRPAAKPRIVRILWYFVVQAVVLATWIFFRSPGFGDGRAFLKNILRFELIQPPHAVVVACLFLGPIVVMHLYAFMVEHEIVTPLSNPMKAAIAGLLLLAVVTLYGQSTDFIYFQF